MRRRSVGRICAGLVGQETDRYLGLCADTSTIDETTVWYASVCISRRMVNKQYFAHEVSYYNYRFSSTLRTNLMWKRIVSIQPSARTAVDIRRISIQNLSLVELRYRPSLTV